MDEIILQAERRATIGKKSKALRRDGKLPAVIYGHGVEPTPIVMDMREASRILASVGSSTLVQIDLEGQKHAALVRERQRDIMLRTLTHVDFLALSMTETVQTAVRVHLGEEEAPAVEAFGAMIITGLEELQIECLPQDLPELITVDISGLKSIGDSILVKDLVPPKGVTILDDPEGLIVVATAPAAEAAEEEAEELLDEGMEPEVIEKGKGEDDED